ncbi:CocE/NonD family hydrolase [Streptomyces canus]|uniref:CocE/NonD family hydrolase n=1 Tax=Streptomyces canus TaxID=58343 RepID=UPI00277EF808|nr:CocE/NonD family hydrolase [Streptomyces canus]MDQ0764872.1 hypothetical protein [Streptomyces canus]
MTEIRVESDVPTQTRDGMVLRADVYRPGGSGPWPVLLSRLPYRKQTPLALAILDPLAAARRGFMVVLQDTRGRFASEGGWEPWTHEESDGYDTVRWAAALPGANGSVGTCGDHRLEAGAGSQLAHRAAQRGLDGFGQQRGPAPGFGVAAAQRHLRQHVEFRGAKGGPGTEWEADGHVEWATAQVTVGHLLGHAWQLDVDLA